MQNVGFSHDAAHFLLFFSLHKTKDLHPLVKALLMSTYNLGFNGESTKNEPRCEKTGLGDFHSGPT